MTGSTQIATVTARCLFGDFPLGALWKILRPTQHVAQHHRTMSQRTTAEFHEFVRDILDVTFLDVCREAT